MKLLILTQKVDKNDDLLGFFHRWIAEFARHCEQVTVIALGVGEYDLPANVKVLSLGKEKLGNYPPSAVEIGKLGNSSPGAGIGKFDQKGYSQNSNSLYLHTIRRFALLLNFFRYIWQERKNYDTVFVHMNKEYVLLGGWLWRVMGKNISLWYTHKQVDWGLRLAEKLVHRIFTASRESFRLPSSKVLVTGHGIDTDYFRPPASRARNDRFEIIYVGRLSRIKNQMLALEAVGDLVRSGRSDIHLNLIGGCARPEDEAYRRELKDYIAHHNLHQYIILSGPVPHREILPFYHGANLALNLCPTGGLDKAVLEAVACGVPVAVLNDSFRPVIDRYFVKDREGLVGLLRQGNLEPSDPAWVGEMSVGGLVVKILAV